MPGTSNLPTRSQEVAGEQQMPLTQVIRTAQIVQIAEMETLSAFLDDVTDGDESVRSRLAAEGITSL
jgi:hypothetical protein